MWLFHGIEVLRRTLILDRIANLIKVEKKRHPVRAYRRCSWLPHHQRTGVDWRFEASSCDLVCELLYYNSLKEELINFVAGNVVMVRRKKRGGGSGHDPDVEEEDRDGRGAEVGCSCRDCGEA